MPPFLGGLRLSRMWEPGGRAGGRVVRHSSWRSTCEDTHLQACTQCSFPRCTCTQPLHLGHVNAQCSPSHRLASLGMLGYCRSLTQATLSRSIPMPASANCNLSASRITASNVSAMRFGILPEYTTHSLNAVTSPRVSWVMGVNGCVAGRTVNVTCPPPCKKKQPCTSRQVRALSPREINAHVGRSPGD